MGWGIRGTISAAHRPRFFGLSAEKGVGPWPEENEVRKGVILPLAKALSKKGNSIPRLEGLR